jgi:hypothetical protein
VKIPVLPSRLPTAHTATAVTDFARFLHNITPLGIPVAFVTGFSVFLRFYKIGNENALFYVNV